MAQKMSIVVSTNCYFYSGYIIQDHSQVRKFSTSPTLGQMVKPPVQIYGIEGRYATALYSAASKKKTLEGVEKDLLIFQASLKSDAKLKEFVENPTIKRNLKANGLKAIAEKISLKPEASNLLQILAENGRLAKLDGVINAFKTIMAAHRGEVCFLIIVNYKLLILNFLGNM